MNNPQEVEYKIIGNGNIVVSNVHGSTITINCNNSEEIQKLLNEFSEKLPNTLLTLLKEALEVNQLQNILKRLTQSSKNLIANIRNNIGGHLHFERNETLSDLENAIIEYPMTIIHGHAGMGKSGITKAFVEKYQSESNQVFAFKGDELIGNNLDEIISKKVGLPTNTIELFKKSESAETILIWVDSLEKLLESNQKDAFIDLLRLLSVNTNIRLVVTIRTYALHQLRFSFLQYQFTKIKIIEIQPLSNEEQKKVLESFPFFQPLFENPRIESLIRTPFYLNEAVGLKNSPLYDVPETLDEITLKKHLWQGTIEGSKHSLTLDKRKRRGSIFLEIAIKRAKALSLMIPLDNPDYESIETLKKDFVIVTDDENERFAPAHDIFEDWALSKYIQKSFAEKTNTSNFFNSIGSEFPIRRGFRLWLQEKLKTQDTEINDFIYESINTPSVKQHWKDEILVSVLQSDNGFDFLQTNQKYLLADNAKHLGRFITVFRTACKSPKIQPDTKRFTSWNFIPQGQGWGALLRFMYENLQYLTSYYSSIIEFIRDWENKIDNFFHIPRNLQNEARQAALLLIHILSSVEEKFIDGIFNPDTKSYEQAMNSLFHLVTVATPEMESLLREALLYHEDERRKKESFYNKIIEQTLSYYNAWQVHYVLPDLVCEAAIQIWKFKPKKNDEWGHYRDSDRLEEFGLEKNYRLNYFPASAYQTPIYSLLLNQTVKGLGLVIEIINHSTLNYIKNLVERSAEKTQCMRRLIGNDDYIEVEIMLNDGKIVKQYGNYVLYQMFRGTGQATPYLLQSVLMALEKYLLELASSKNEKDHDFLRLYFDYLLESSVSIATTAVLASVAMAYPEAVGDRVFSLMTIKEIYEWDISRMVSESGSFIPIPVKGYDNYFKDERIEANQLQHRKKMFESFITELAFNKPEYSNRIFAILDKFYTEINDNDYQWKLKLNKMDIRKWQITDTVVSETQTGFIVEAVIDEDIKKEFEPFHQEQAKTSEIHKYSNWAFFDIYQGKNLENNTYQEWVNAYKSSVKAFEDGYYGFIAPMHTPAAIAHIGLNHHLSGLNLEEKEWCIEIVILFSEIFIEKAKNPYDIGFMDDKANSPNLFDEEPSLTILPFLLKEEFDEDTRQKARELIFEGLISWHFTDNLKKRYFECYRENLWQIAPTVAMACWAGIVQLANIKKERNSVLKMPKEYYGKKEHKLAQKFEKQISELKQTVVKGTIQPNFSNLSFENYDSSLLINALLIIPYNTQFIVLHDFIKQYMAILFESAIEKKNDFSQRPIDNMRDRFEFNEFLSFYLLNQPIEDSIPILDLWLNLRDKITERYYRGDTYEFIDRTLMFMILRTDENNKYTNSFNALWNHFERSEKIGFSHRLFLKLEWKQDADNWNPLKGRKTFYYHAIAKHGHYELDVVLELLSGIGTTELLPECILSFVEAIKRKEEISDKIVDFNFYYAEKLIERMFCLHRASIRSNRKMLDSFVYFLDKMVLQGSSLAFYARENLIALS